MTSEMNMRDVGITQQTLEIDSRERRLNELGYKQELRRDMVCLKPSISQVIYMLGLVKNLTILILAFFFFFFLLSWVSSIVLKTGKVKESENRLIIGFLIRSMVEPITS